MNQDKDHLPPPASAMQRARAAGAELVRKVRSGDCGCAKRRETLRKVAQKIAASVRD